MPNAYRRFPPSRSYQTLSARDVIEARDAYHVHLSNLQNVVGTAIGLHRFRRSELAGGPTPRPARDFANRPARTVANSTVTRRSWPCVLVLVDAWKTPEELADDPDQVVPRLLYLPDGRAVPTCVLRARRDDRPEPPVERLGFASEQLGGGYPVLSDVQGVEHAGTLGCVVTDGRYSYALTARHVCGRPGEALYTVVQGERERMGTSSDRQVGKRADGTSIANLDAGLIELDDVTRWTAQVFGIGEIGETVDLSADTFSLDLIGCPVRAFGAASGVLEGEIHGLLYRYRSMAGHDYIADLLIGPRSPDQQLATRTGDSGTLWFYDPPRRPKPGPGTDDDHPWDRAAAPERGLRARRLRPIAMQWGGQRLVADDDESCTQVAMATLLSTICTELDVQVVTDWSTGHDEYWGKTSHFKMGAKACELVKEPALRDLMQLNRLRIGFDDERLQQGQAFRVGRDRYVPLADVPDYVWIAHAFAGRASRIAEPMQHFADMDEPGFGEFEGRTLVDLCKTKAQVDPALWARFYASFPADQAPQPGCLPFRIWQLWNDMKESVRERDLVRFVAGAGVLAHYAADACQPMHVSRWHHGYGPRHGTPEWEAYRKTPQYKIHRIYEQVMFEVRAVEMLQKIDDHLRRRVALAKIADGRSAAWEAVKLMKKALLEVLPPEEIIQADDPSLNAPRRGELLFERVGDKTAQLVASGCVLIASLWESAWVAGGGARVAKGAIREIGEGELSRVVRGDGFVPSTEVGALVGMLG